MSIQLSKTEAVGFAWKTVTGNLRLFTILCLLPVLSGIVTQLFFLISLTSKQYWLVVTVAILSWAPIMIFAVGVINISLKFSKGENATVSDIFSWLPVFFKLLAGQILYLLIVLGGTILLVVPGIIWGIKFSFFSYAILDKKMGPIAALKESARITQGNKWNLFLLPWVVLLAAYVGAISSAQLAFAASYTKLSGQADQKEIPAATPREEVVQPSPVA